MQRVSARARARSRSHECQRWGRFLQLRPFVLARLARRSPLTYALGGVLGYLGRFGSPSLRCLMWASGGSFFYGLSSAMVKTIAELVQRGGFLQRPLFWTVAVFLLVCYVVGGWMVQQGYANGPAEIVVGSMTTTDPIVAVTFGLAVLGEGVRLGPLDALGMALSGAVAVAGVVVLSKYHPDAQVARPVAASVPAGGPQQVE